MKLVGIIVFLCMLVSFESSAELKQEWVSMDVEVIRLIQSIFPIDSITLSKLQILRQQVENTQYETKELGFGAKRHTMIIGGGYTSIRIQFLTYHGELAHIQVRHDLSSQYEQELRQMFAPFWEPFEIFAQEGYRYESRKPLILEAFHTEISQELGAPPPLPQWLTQDNEKAWNACQFLMNPFADYDYGTHCYYAGIEPEGRKAIVLLSQHNDLTAIRRILRSPSPEGRMYALEVLLQFSDRRGVLSKTDADAIQKLVTLDTPISVCMGCIISRYSAREIIRMSW